MVLAYSGIVHWWSFSKGGFHGIKSSIAISFCKDDFYEKSGPYLSFQFWTMIPQCTVANNVQFCNLVRLKMKLMNSIKSIGLLGFPLHLTDKIARLENILPFYRFSSWSNLDHAQGGPLYGLPFYHCVVEIVYSGWSFEQYIYIRSGTTHHWHST